MSTNFSFVKDIDPTAYSELVKIEKEARLDPKQAGYDCRSLLEKLAKKVLNANHIRRGKDLNENIEIWKSTHSLNYPFGMRAKYLVIDADSHVYEKKDEGFTFVRKFGNSATHGYNFAKNAEECVICTQAVFDSLRIFHEYFTRTYKESIGDIEPFSEKKIPIGDYSIFNEYEPNDTERSKCIKEYVAQKEHPRNPKNKLYALIREYDTHSLDSLFLDRNIDSFWEIYGKLYSDNVRIEKLNQTDNEFANFFIAYEFTQKFTMLGYYLNNNIISMRDRLSICLQIAKQIERFHKADDPVYHRALSYESIVLIVSKNGEQKYQPYIVKFDFAKLTGITEGTVYKHLSDAESKESMRLARYRLDDLSPDSKWDKVDIGALGVLFIDIMMNKISYSAINAHTFEMLEKEGISSEMLDMIDEMLCDVQDERPDITRVVEAISKEYARHG